MLSPYMTDHTSHVSDIEQNRRTVAELLSARTIASDIRATDTQLGGIPAVEITVDTIEPIGTALWVHGGGYIAGSPRMMLAPTATFARATRLRVLSVEYRLAPEHPYPAAVDDLLAAYRATLTMTTPRQLVVGGESAGGGLAISLLVAARNAGLALPRAAAVFSPTVDLTLAGQSVDLQHGLDPLLTREGLALGFQAYAGDHLADASPLNAELRGLPSLYISAGTHEILLDDAVRLARRAALADVDVTLELGAGQIHGFPIGRPGDANVDLALRRLSSWTAGQLE